MGGQCAFCFEKILDYQEKTWIIKTPNFCSLSISQTVLLRSSLPEHSFVLIKSSNGGLPTGVYMLQITLFSGPPFFLTVSKLPSPLSAQEILGFQHSCSAKLFGSASTPKQS